MADQKWVDFFGRLGFASIISRSQDPTNNSQTANPNFRDFFDELQQVLQVLLIHLLFLFVQNNLNSYTKTFENFIIGCWI